MAISKKNKNKAKPAAKKYSYDANKDSDSIVSEDYIIYGKRNLNGKTNGIHNSFSAVSVLDKNAAIILEYAHEKPESHMTALEKMDAVRFGISKKDLENLKVKASLDYDKLAKILSVTRATLINKKKQEKFNSSLSERIISLADIYSYGYEVFEDNERFNQWMFKPNQALNGKAPYDLIDNQFGREEVRNLIGRIDYGVYS